MITTWALHFMIVHPDVQNKVRAEIDFVTGRARLPHLSDMKNTPYTQAVIHEVFRKANLVPITHHFSADGGNLHNGDKIYAVPPKTTVVLNYGAVVSDPHCFPNPDLFDPDRFLNNQGQFQPDKKLVTFGLGKRRCPGKK